MQLHRTKSGTLLPIRLFDQVSQLEDALRQLYVLEAIDADGKITDVGKEMSKLPVDPSLARALLASADFG